MTTNNQTNHDTSTQELREGYIKVRLDYAPKTNGKKMREWCDKHGFAFIGAGRRAWCGSLGTYLRGASGVAYADGEPFLFDEDDLIDVEAIINTRIAAVLDRVEGEMVGELDERIRYNNREATLSTSRSASEWHRSRADLLSNTKSELVSKLKALRKELS